MKIALHHFRPRADSDERIRALARHNAHIPMRLVGVLAELEHVAQDRDSSSGCFYLSQSPERRVDRNRRRIVRVVDNQRAFRTFEHSHPPRSEFISLDPFDRFHHIQFQAVSERQRGERRISVIFSENSLNRDRETVAFHIHAENYSPGSAVFIVGNRLSDRKSTRLNSSHSSISYAVFCFKK